MSSATAHAIPAPSPADRPIPTDEQAAIIDACTQGVNVVVLAGAGSGKTATLVMAAEAMRGRGLYVAYNKAIATEAKAKFPDSVTCATAHSLAYRAVGFRYRHRLNGPRVTAQQAAKTLEIN